MRRRTFRVLGLLVVVCLLVGVVAALLFRPKLPRYNGQSLDFWFRNLPYANVPDPWGLVTTKVSLFEWPMAPPDPGEKKATEALVAIRAMGVNSLPFLMRKLKRPEPRQGFDRLRRSYLAKLPYIQQLLPTRHQVFVERHQAVTGLVALCPLPPDTVLELRKLSLDFQSANGHLADDILRANDNPRLRDMALSSYFVDKAAIEGLRRLAASGPLNNGPSLFGPESPPGPIHETLGLTNSLWGNH